MSLPADELRHLAETVLARCRAKGWTLATAESCTGGMVAAALTDIAGASDIVERGFVTYSNRAKSELLGVPRELIEKHGAVSAETAATPPPRRPQASRTPAGRQTGGQGRQADLQSRVNR